MADDLEFRPDDIKAAREWLRGEVRKGSLRDLQARRTLARMLRSDPPDVGLLFILADAIDPDGEGGQRLFLKRKPGHPRRINQRHVASFIYQKTKAGASWKAAVQEAMNEFRCARATVTAAWAVWQKHIKDRPETFGRV
jgi:hypothetical protein